MATPREQYWIQRSNVLAKSIVEDILHQSLLKEIFLEYFPRRFSKISNSTISSTSSDSFFGILDPDLPSDDEIFSARARSKSISEKFRNLRNDERDLWLDWDPPPTPTRRLINDIKKNDLVKTTSRSQNSLVNRFQKSVTFPKIELIRWPQAKFFNQEIGREKIIEMIEKTWNYSTLLTYTVEFISTTGHHCSQRYRYLARWYTPNGNIAHVYFNVDVPKMDSERIVTVTYTFENGKIIHK